MDGGRDASITVLIADDFDVVRAGLRSILSVEDDIKLVGEAADGWAALALALELKPDVVLMDLQMPEMDGVAATEAICAHLPATRVVMLTSFTEEEHVLPAIRAGASGYLLKDASGAQVVDAIRAVARGDSLLDPAATQRLVAWVASRPQEPSPPRPLTPRELDVLRLVVRGMRNKEIARALGTAENTVKEQLSSILTKLELNDRTQAALYAVRTGLVPLDD
jgi:DNA-binding NarL/FixJ family response regulator